MKNEDNGVQGNYLDEILYKWIKERQDVNLSTGFSLELSNYMIKDMVDKSLVRVNKQLMDDLTRASVKSCWVDAIKSNKALINNLKKLPTEEDDVIAYLEKQNDFFKDKIKELERNE